MKTIIFIVGILCCIFLSCDKNTCEEYLINDCICTKQYDPVCGCNGVTYGNACMAECNSITEYTKGACRVD